MTDTQITPDTAEDELDLDAITANVKRHHEQVVKTLTLKRKMKENLSEEIRDLVAKEHKAARAVKALDRQVK